VIQRRDLETFADGIRGWLRGEDDDLSMAAGANVADVIVMLRQTLKGDKNG
jgi:hypothetical protein